MSFVNYGISSNKQNAAVQQETEDKLENNEQAIVKTKKKKLTKKNKFGKLNQSKFKDLEPEFYKKIFHIIFLLKFN